MMISTNKSIIFSNKNGELYSLNENNGEAKLLRSDFSKNIDSYSYNSTHVYFLEKGGKTIYRTLINFPELEYQKLSNKKK